MLLYTLQAIHVFLGVIALCSGTTAAARMLCGVRCEKWALWFLRCSLISSAAGILLSLYRPDPTRWIAVLGVYVSAVAVVAWRKRRVSHGWVEPFVLSTVAVLCMDALIVIVHLVQFASLSRAMIPDHDSAFVVAAFIMILLFVVLSSLSLRSIHQKANWSVR